MTEATVDLRRTTDQTTRIDWRLRTGLLTMLGVGAGIMAITALLISAGAERHALTVRVVSDAILLLALVAFICLSTRNAIGQLRQQIVADVKSQVSAVVAARVVRTVEIELARGLETARSEAHQYASSAAIARTRFEELAEMQRQLTKEVARQRGQLNIGLGELAEAVERVEARVTADVDEIYQLGRQSARD